MGNSILQPGQYYHIYNRGNNGELLFKTEKHYSLFLDLYAKYIYPVADTLAYCLMSNHFHLVIRTKEVRDISSFSALKMFENNKSKLFTDKKPGASNQFAHLFNSYTKTINNEYKRTGSLFEHPFERRIIENEQYLKTCIAYVHYNPVKAGYTSKVEEYKWSSFNALVSDRPTHLEREFVIEKLFGNNDLFLLYHEKDPAGFENLIGNKLQNVEGF